MPAQVLTAISVAQHNQARRQPRPARGEPVEQSIVGGILALFGAACITRVIREEREITMHQLGVNELTQRLDRLERANRSLRIGIAAVFLFAITLFGVTQVGTVSAQPRTLDVERLIVRDQNGVVRAALFVASPGRGEVSFNLNDQNGDPLISMGGIDGTSVISMLDAGGRQRVFVQVGPDALGNDRGPTISLYDDGHTQIWTAP